MDPADKMDFEEFRKTLTEAIPEAEADPLLIHKAYLFYSRYGEDLQNGPCAEFLDTTPGNLNFMRYSGKGPEYRKLSRVRYPLFSAVKYVLGKTRQTAPA